MDKSKTKSKKKHRKSSSSRAGLLFPVKRIRHLLCTGEFAERITMGSAAYLSAVMQYLTAEILVLAGNVASANRKKLIISRHLQTAIMNDQELKTLLMGVTFAQEGS
ncbi:histone H2A, orphon-like [Musca autumnalis]|uniref:histone H2A, orphon-like n=1 Tax=Musca autumnalis TaxID=221902 RepID=UPI003CF2D097